MTHDKLYWTDDLSPGSSLEQCSKIFTFAIKIACVPSSLIRSREQRQGSGVFPSSASQRDLLIDSLISLLFFCTKLRSERGSWKIACRDL